MSALQFVFAAFGSAIAISFVSLLWPKFTSKPSPPALTQVRHIVEQTPVGQQAANVLGVTDDATSQPVNLGQWAASQGNSIISNIENSASQVVVSGVTRQIIGQIDKLPSDQKVQLQQILCSQPTTSQASPSATK